MVTQGIVCSRRMGSWEASNWMSRTIEAANPATRAVTAIRLARRGRGIPTRRISPQAAIGASKITQGRAVTI